MNHIHKNGKMIILRICTSLNKYLKEHRGGGALTVGSVFQMENPLTVCRQVLTVCGLTPE